MKIIAKHKWVVGATITESYDETDDSYRCFTATIRGWRNWKIYEGRVDGDTSSWVIVRVKEIRDRIDTGDESVFYEVVSLGDTPDDFDYDTGRGKRIKEVK